MKPETVTTLYVYYTPSTEKTLVGKLFWNLRDVYFEYDPLFVQGGLQLSPFKLPLKGEPQRCTEDLFEGLFGVFNDSLPDGWGRLLIDRKLSTVGVNPRNLSPLDRLSYVGSRGMGILTYEPEIESATLLKFKELDAIAEEVKRYQKQEDESLLDDLLAMNGSSAGARPKALLPIRDEDWIIKFPSSHDPKDIGPIEWAYHLMAKEAGLELPPAKLFLSKRGPGYFGVKRFDRESGKRIHMHTLSGLVHADHRFPSLDYDAILKATHYLTKDIREVEKQFRAAAFNVLSYNRDDHAKNFSFLMDEKGKWQVSPAYDLTYSSGPRGEHCTMVLGEGKHPTKNHLFKLAHKEGVQEAVAKQIIDEVEAAVNKWEHFAREAGVSSSSSKTIQNSLSE